MTEHDEITALRARVAELEAQWDEWEAAETNLAVAEARVAELTRAFAKAEKRANDWLSAASEWRQRADAAEARVAELEADVARARLSSAVLSCAVLGWALIQGIWLISHARFA